MARWIFAFTSTVAFASIFFLPQDLHPSLQSINSIFELKIFCFAFSQTLVLTSRMTTSSQTLFSLHPHAGFIDDECKVIEEPTRLKSGSDNLRSSRVLTSRSFLAKSLSTCLASALLTCASGGFIPDPSLAASLDDFAVVSAKTFHSNSEKIYQNNPTNRTPFKFSTLSVSDSTTTSITNDMKNLGLKPPTADRPQIMLNNNFRKVPMSTLQPEDTPATLFLKSSNKKKPAREPILQGLVYFPQKAGSDATTSTSQTTATSETTPLPSPPMDMKPKPQLDLYSDILVLTAVSANHPDGPILAGAKFPVADVRFPFQFQMFQENLLINREGVKEAWFGTASSDGNSNKMCGGVAATQDVIIRAYICPSDASSFPCDAGQAKRYAEGIAKLITDLEGMGEGDVIRAPASLALR